MLGTYPEVTTTSEPWLLLELLAPLRRGTPGDVGWQQTLNTAVAEFIRELRGGEEEYLRAVRSLASELYSDAAAPGTRYFLDKTPPYHWIADELFRVFPEGRFVFLWRNPLAVMSSIMETWCAGRWRPDRYSGALFHGVENLVAAFERHSEQALAVRYEDLLDPAGEAWRRLTEYLDLSFDPTSVADFSAVSLAGRTGDPTGTVRYGQLSREPLGKWQSTVATPLRRAWCRRYLRWIGARRLTTMGYSLEGLLADLDRLEIENPRLGRDALDIAVSASREAVLARIRGDRAPRTWARLRRS
jgi:hypothetical protein